jgi:hypothetical protein
MTSEVRTWGRRSDTFDMMRVRTGNRVSGILGMLATLWATIMILASEVEAPWKVLLGLVGVAGFFSFLLQFRGTGRSDKGQDKL